MGLFAKCFLSNAKRRSRSESPGKKSPQRWEVEVPDEESLGKAIAEQRQKELQARFPSITLDQMSLVRIVLEMQRAAGVEVPKEAVDRQVESIFDKVRKRRHRGLLGKEGLTFGEIVWEVCNNAKSLELHGLLPRGILTQTIL